MVLSPGDFSVVLRALQTVNRGRVLSLPKVLVNNNQQATLNSVLRQPFVSVNASDTIATTSFGGSENAGTIISIKPQIAEGDHLVLQYSVSLSSFVGDAIDPTVPPPKQSNNLSSLVTIPDGYIVVVGGLESPARARASHRFHCSAAFHSLVKRSRIAQSLHHELASSCSFAPMSCDTRVSKT